VEELKEKTVVNKPLIAFLDGTFVPFDDPCLMLKGIFLGERVYMDCRVVDGVVEFFETHRRAFLSHCEALSFYPPYIGEEYVRELLKRNHIDKGCWRLRVAATGGEERDKLPFSHLVMTLLREETHHPNDLHLDQKIGVMDTSQAHVSTFSRLEKLREYVQDHLLTTKEGVLLETAQSNIFWHQEGHIFTPDPALPLLFGVSLMGVLCAAEAMGLEIHYVKNTVEEIPQTSQLFLCNCFTHIQRVESIGDKKFSTNATFEQTLNAHYHRLVEEFILE